LEFEESIQIREKVIGSCKERYGKFPTKPQFILETIEQQGSSVSLLDLSKIMHYKLHLLENWVLRLNAEKKITVKGEYPDWVLSKYKEV